MPEKIRGITVEIGGDTSGLSKALKSSNKEIRSTQTQLKDVDKLLKLDPTNIDLLKQREKLLNDAVKETGDKLTNLKEIQRTMDENGVDKNSEQYMALQREIISTEQDLNKLKTAARDSNAVLSQVGAVAEKVAAKTEKLAQKTRALSGAAAGALGLLLKSGYDAVTRADDINTAAAQSGFSTREIQQFEYAADRIDVSADTIIGAGKKLKKSMTSTSKDTTAAFERLGVSTTNADGTLRNSTDVFWDCVAALGNIEDETERDAIAMAIFGKSADELAGLIDDGGEAFHRYAEEAEGLGLILDQETLDSLNAVNDEIDKLKAMFKAAWAKNGAKVIEKLTPVFEKLAEKVEKAVEWFSNLSSDDIWRFMKMLAAIAAISPVLLFFAKLATGVSKLTKALKVIKPAIIAVNAVLAANPIILIIAAIAALIIAIVKFKDKIIGALDKVSTWLHDKLGRDWTEVFGPVLGGVMNKFCEGFLKVWDRVKGYVEDAIHIIHGIFTGDWSEVWEAAKEAVTTACGDMREGLNDFDGWMNRTFTQDWTEKFGDRVGGWMNTASEKILTCWNDDIKPALDDAIDWLEDTFSGDWEHAWNNIKELGSKIWDKIKEGWDSLTGALSTAWDAVKKGFDDSLAWLKATFSVDWGKAWEDIKSVGSGVWDKIKEGWDTITSGLSTAWDGVKQGFDDTLTWLGTTFGVDWAKAWEDVKATGSGIWDKIKEGWSDITSGLSTAWDGVKENIGSVTSWLSDTFSGDWEHAWENISALGDTVWEGIKTAWDGVKGKFSGVNEWLNKTFLEDWRTVWSGVSSVGSGIWDGITSAWDAVKDAFDSVLTWLSETFSGGWSGIWSGLRETFDGLWDGMSGVLKAPLNAVIKLINKAVGGINSLIDGANKIPFVNIPHITEIPLLAKGGTVGNGGMAIVGEAGAELLTVRSGRATVTPLTGGNAGGGTANSITIYTQEMTAAQVDYILARVNRGIGVMA